MCQDCVRCRSKPARTSSLTATHGATLLRGEVVDTHHSNAFWCVLMIASWFNFQACAVNHSAISPSLESTTYGLLHLAQKAFCVRPPNVPRSLTGARAEAKAPKRPAPDPSTMLFATTRQRSTQFLLRRRATKTHDRVVATVPALTSRRTHRDCWSTGDPGN